MVDLERSIYDYIHNLLFSKEKIMNTLNSAYIDTIFLRVYNLDVVTSVFHMRSLPK